MWGAFLTLLMNCRVDLERLKFIGQKFFKSGQKSSNLTCAEGGKTDEGFSGMSKRFGTIIGSPSKKDIEVDCCSRIKRYYICDKKDINVFCINENADDKMETEVEPVNIEHIVDDKVKIRSDSDPKCEKTELNFAKKRHLHSAKKTKVKSHDMGLDALRGSLSKKLKSNRVKLNQGTPEKSEIYLMFEKIKLKRDQKMAIQSPNNGQINSKIIDPDKPIIKDKIELSSPVPENPQKIEEIEDLPTKKSPILQPKKLSKLKFDELRSIFDVGAFLMLLMNYRYLPD